MTVADTWPGGKDYATENLRQHTRRMSKTPYVMNKTQNRVAGTVSSSSRPKDIAEIQIRDELRCGDLGRIITLHGVVYQPLSGFGLNFEAYVAKTIAEYVLDNSSRGRVWLAERDKDLVGQSPSANRPRASSAGCSSILQCVASALGTSSSRWRSTTVSSAD